MISVKRYLLGMEYQKIARELFNYDTIPYYVMSREQKERVAELLEREAELDIQLAEYLIKDGDDLGIKQLKFNSKTNAVALWNLKQDLAIN